MRGVWKTLLVLAVAAALAAPLAAGFIALPGSGFEAEHEETVLPVNLTQREGAVPFRSDVPERWVESFGVKGAAHVATFLLDGGERYTILESADGRPIGVLWREVDGEVVDPVVHPISTRLVKADSGKEENGSFVREWSAETYLLDSPLMPEGIKGYTHVVVARACVTWTALGERLAKVCAKARFYVDYGHAVLSARDLSFDRRAPGVTRCRFSHRARAQGVDGFVRADGHYMICLLLGSKHATMGAWTGVDAWLNVGPPGWYGSENGALFCNCGG